MKKMRSALSLALCIILAIICVVQVFAENISYKLDDLGMSISIPDSMTVTTRSDSDTSNEAYLQAKSADGSLIISVFMEPASSVQTFVGLSKSTLDDIKDKFNEEGFTAGKVVTYGDVPFLDFSRNDTDTNKVNYIKQSLTVIDSMEISVISQSAEDYFSDDELNLITGCLNSIRFDSIQKQQKIEAKETAKSRILFVVLILIVAAIIIGVLVLRKKLAKKKALGLIQNKSSYPYEVKRSRSADENSRQSQIGGYKTSTDFFDEYFDNTPTPAKGAEQTQQTEKKKTGAITRLGYFAKNLGREINKSKNKNKAPKSKNKKQKNKAVDYDIFSDK